jgi:hypothetical protein
MEALKAFAGGLGEHTFHSADPTERQIERHAVSGLSATAWIGECGPF